MCGSNRQEEKFNFKARREEVEKMNKMVAGRGREGDIK